MNVLLRFTSAKCSLPSALLCLVFIQAALADDSLSSVAIENSLSLEQAISISIENDLTLSRTGLEIKSLIAEVESKSNLPDPIFFASMQNLPTDTFDLDQEAMTQMRVGVKQMFPKGDSVELSKNVVRSLVAISENQHVVNALKLKQKVEAAWLESWYWQNNKAIVEHDRVFLTQMLDFIQSMYQLGSKNQSDLIGAELELIKLDEKLLDADRQYLQFRQELHGLANQDLPQLIIAPNLPDLPFHPVPNKTQLFTLLQTHPELESLDNNVRQMSDKVKLAEQDEKAQWGIEVSYGLRHGNNMDGSDRADFLSAGFSVQLPLFSGAQKQQSVRALRYKQESVENIRLERLQKIYYELENLRLQYENTVSQANLYTTKILPTLIKQKDSALQSYQADKGDFRVVTDLYLKEQMTRVKQLRLKVMEQLLVSKMNYWLDIDAIKPYLNNLTAANQERMK